MQGEQRRTLSRGNDNHSLRYLALVDGDANHRFYLSMLLQRFEYRVVAAATVEEALGTLAVAVPLLVITDVDLPADGTARLLQQLRHDPKTSSTPVIGLLSNGTDSKALFRAGYHACIYKPAPAEELFRTVQASIEPTPRSNIRIHTKLPVIIDGKPLDCVEGECASVLSEHGMYIRTLRPSPANLRIAVTLMVNGRAIPISAEVRYSHRFGEGPFGEPGMGLKFTGIAAHDQEYLRNFIREDVTRGIG